jgi:hypothetical protein
MCTALRHIKLDKKREEEFLDLLQVLKSHMQNCDYMIIFFYIYNFHLVLQGTWANLPPLTPPPPPPSTPDGCPITVCKS